MVYNFYEGKFEYNDDSPFYGNTYDFEESEKIIDNGIEEIMKSENIRHIVIESWLIIDYFVRNAIGQLFRFKEIGTEQYDLRYKILPISFDQCLNIFYETLELQRSLETNPNHNSIALPPRFYRFIKKEHKEFFDEFLRIENLYYKEYYPSLIYKIIDTENIQVEDIEDITEEILSYDIPRKRKPNYVYDIKWLETHKVIDEDWIKKARKINKARNQAAHSYDNSKVIKALGYSGEDSFDHAKQECLDIIQTLLRIKNNR